MKRNTQVGIKDLALAEWWKLEAFAQRSHEKNRLLRTLHLVAEYACSYVSFQKKDTGFGSWGVAIAVKPHPFPHQSSVYQRALNACG